MNPAFSIPNLMSRMSALCDSPLSDAQISLETYMYWESIDGYTILVGLVISYSGYAADSSIF